MPDATRRASYPLVRNQRMRRHRRWRLPRVAWNPRIVAVGIVCLLIAVAVIALVLKPAAPDRALAAKALADSRSTLAAGNFSAARSNAQAAIAADPAWAPPHLALARAWLALSDGLAGEAELTRAADAGIPAARLHAARAEAKLLQGDPDGANSESLKASPADVAYAARIRARALAANDDSAGARQALAALIGANPKDAAAWRDLGRLRLTAGDVAGADQASAHAVALARADPDGLVLRGEVVRSRYGLVAALPWFEAALKRDAYYPPALIQYAATLGDAGRYAEMLAATRVSLAARPGNPQALYLQAVLAARAGRYDLSRSLLQRTGGSISGLPGVVLLSATLDSVEGKYEQAIGKLRQLVAGQPMNLVARRMLGSVLLRSGDARGSIDTLRPMLLRDDADSYTLRLAARAFEALGDRDDAARMLDRAGSATRGAAMPFASDESAGALAAGAADAPDDPTFAVGLIRGLADDGAANDALIRARALVLASPGAAPAQLAIGDAYAALNRYGEAANAYARAADLVFDEPTMLRLVDALGRAGRARDAASALALYLSQNPQSLTGQRLAGHWQVAGGQWDAAIETLEGVRTRLGNRDAGLLTDLALAYAGDGDGDVAKSYGAAACRLSPMSAAAADAYGWALHISGDDGGARQLLVKARTLAPADRTIAAHLAQVSPRP